MRTFIENYLHFMKNCIRPPYEKLKSLKSGFIENSNFENNRDPCTPHSKTKRKSHHGKFSKIQHLFTSIKELTWFSPL